VSTTGYVQRSTGPTSSRRARSAIELMLTPSSQRALHQPLGNAEELGRSLTSWIKIGTGIRLRLSQLDDGWGWHAWEYLARGAWLPLRTPTAENSRRRFKVRGQAEEFFRLLSEVMFGDYAGGPPRGRA
jgi:hypothetical protein